MTLDELDRSVLEMGRAAVARAVAEERGECAETCINLFRDAENFSPEYRQNKISHGCIACAAAIRARGGEA